MRTVDLPLEDRIGQQPEAAVLSNGRVRVTLGAFEADLHPLWLRERSQSEGAIDPSNGQRLHEPTDVHPDLGVVACSVVTCGGTAVLDVTFTDGHRTTVPTALIVEGQAIPEPVPTPSPIPWGAADLDEVPRFDYRRLAAGGTDGLAPKREILKAFFEFGFFVLSETPAEPGALLGITGHFGRISPTNFGTLFDVRTEPLAVDLAYTPVALSAHTDQPYRRPAPDLQFLHTIVNDAPGGASTVVDGLAAVESLAVVDPEAYDLLCSLPIEFRYDIGSDVKVAHAPLIERSPDGSLRQFRFSPRLDFAPLVDADTLDVFYRGRRWLAAALNDPSRQIEYRMEAGEVLVVDNHRVLHGRTSFDPTQGHRHLQGCYIDRDGPETEWVLVHRSVAERDDRTD